MKIFIIICVLILISVVVFMVATRKYRNPYRLYMCFGKKGSGKTTYLTKLSYQYSKKGWKVFSTEELPFATTFDVQQLGRFVPPENSVLLIDEVGMIWDNRNFKNFRTDVRDFFKLQRHYKCIVYLFSQTFDIDIKLRNLTDAMYLLTSPLPVLSVVRRIKRRIVLVQPNQESEGRIADSLEFVPIWMSLFGSKSLQLTWIPRWAKYFQTDVRPELPEFEFDSDKVFKKKKNRKMHKTPGV